MKEKEYALQEVHDVCVCPKCQGNKTKIYESRHTSYGWRRLRKCLECSYRYATMEVLLSEYNGMAEKIENQKNTIKRYIHDSESMRRFLGLGRQ